MTMAILRKWLSLILWLVSQWIMIMAADPISIRDYCPADPGSKTGSSPVGFPCKNMKFVNSSDFISSLLVKPGNPQKGLLGSAVTVASAANFPGLNGQGLSFGRIDYMPGGMVPLHYHPRASELLFVSSGSLIVGFVDTNNKFYGETLSPGEIFVFPKGLMHFIRNVGDKPATTFSALNGQSPGLVSIMNSLFTSDSQILEDAVKKSLSLSSKDVIRLRSTVSAAPALSVSVSSAIFPAFICLHAFLFM